MEPNIVVTPTPFYKKKIFFISVIILILIPLGFYIFKTYFLKIPGQQPGEVSSEATIKEEDLPVAVEILKNPMVYEWRGSVVGTLTAKDEGSITISDDKGNKITIIVRSSSKEITGTTFYKNKPAKDPRSNFVSLDDIPLGTKLGGDFFVFPHQKNQMVGSSFIVSEQ